MLFKYASYNVNGLRQNHKRKSIFYLLKQKQYDLIFLQETHSCMTDEKLWKCEWGGKIIFAHGDRNSKGVAVLFKHSLTFQIISLNIDPAGRFLLIELKINDKVLVIGNIYAPTKEEPEFFDSLFSAIAGFSNADLILGGDWNLVLNDHLDKDGGPSHANKNSKERLKSYMKFFNLKDVFREINPQKKAYTRIQTQLIQRHDWTFF